MASMLLIFASLGLAFPTDCLVPQHAVLAQDAVAVPETEGQKPAIQETVDLSRLKGIAAPADDVEAVQPPEPGPWPGILLLVYCLLIVGASLVGGWLPRWVQLTHTRMQTMISFVGGLMLGIGVFHLMPHAVHELGNANLTARWMMVGIVMMFALIRLFHFHNHEPITVLSVSPDSSTNDSAIAHHHNHDHDHDAHNHDHDHGGKTPVPLTAVQSGSGLGHSAADCHTHGHAHGISGMGIAMGLSLHTLIDGLALGASVHAHAQLPSPGWFLGLGTFLAILLHKPLDAVSITSLMDSGGWSSRSINFVNAGFALMCPLGAALFLMGVSQFSGYQREILGTALAFAAGVFICIALSDLLPEMEFHAHNKVQLTIALGCGIGLSWALTLLETGHLH